MSSSLGVAGGGLLGMTLALRLAQAGHAVTLFEAAPAAGGLASPEAVGEYQWDRFYHVILQSDTALLGLLDELGLSDRLHWGTTRTGFYAGERLYSLSNSLEFLTFPLLGPVDKLRLAATILHASRIRDPRPLERELATDWLRRWSGRRACERMWFPLLQSKLGPNYDRVSAAFIWAIIARMYAARRSGLKREMFGYVDGGYATVLERLRPRLEAAGVTVHTGSTVGEVRETGTGAEIVVDRVAHAFDGAVLTFPAGAVARACPQLKPAERERLEGVTYQGVICASLLLRRPLGGFYVTNILDHRVPFTGVIEMTALVDRERFGGNTLAYLPRYLPAGDPWWERSDGEIREEFLPALARMYPGFSREDVLAFRMARARQVQALSTLHYSERALPPLRTTLPHVWIANSAQIAYGTLNVNETVALAERQARAIHELLPSGSAGPWSGTRNQESGIRNQESGIGMAQPTFDL